MKNHVCKLFALNEAEVALKRRWLGARVLLERVLESNAKIAMLLDTIDKIAPHANSVDK